MNIAILSYPDVNNYGDRLFQHVARQELARRLPGATIDLISPTGVTIDGVEFDHYSPQSFHDFYDAAIFVGGETLHDCWPMFLKLYRLQNIDCPMERPTDLLLGWADAPLAYKAWLFLGSPEPSKEFDPDGRLKLVVPKIDRIVVRGSISHYFLEKYAGPHHATVGPDTGWLFPRYAVARPDLDLSPDRYITFQLYETNLGGTELAWIARHLDELQQRTQLRVALLPIIYMHNDAETLARLDDASGGKFHRLPADLTMFETASVLAQSSFYVGTSMHGAISAMGAGKPAGVIHPKPNRTKFVDLFASIGRSEFLRTSWDALPELTRLLHEDDRDRMRATSQRVIASVDRIYDQVSDEIKAAMQRTTAPASG